ncbi:alpha-galactosidase [Myxococcota bacterium]|nr:alpha-galactosidase [Myxococcota bacterium]
MRSPPLLLAALAAGCAGADPQGADHVPPCLGAPVARADGPSLDASVAGCGGVALSARVLGEGDLSVALRADGDAVVPTVTAGPGGGVLEAVVLEGGAALEGEAPLRLWRQGYQSWSWSGVTEVAEPELDGDGVPLAGGDGDGMSVVDERTGTSWWAGLVGREDRGALLLGALSAARTKLYTAHSQDRAWVVWGHRGEAIPLEPGASVTLDPLWIGFDEDPDSLWRRWAEAAAARVPPRPLPGDPPVGWATWYQYYGDVTEGDVLANLDRAAALNAAGDLAPFGVFQLDDGWEVAWGDWTANERFPSGTAALAGEIAARGMVPGLWMAPFYVDRGTGTYAQHPDWWVRDVAGEELRFTNAGGGDYAVLDATVDEARAWMAAEVRAKAEEGWRYLKLDFLYAGAQEGTRSRDVTGAEAYRLGMEALREAAGDAFVLACGAPLLPTLGLAEAYRTGSDIAFSLAPDPRLEFLRWQARSTAARGFLNGLWWWNDADQVLVREPADAALARGAVVANAVSGGAWLLGDDLAALPEERLAWALDPEVLSLLGARAVPEDPLSFPSGLDGSPLMELALPDDRVPARWNFPGGEVALLNLGAEARATESPGGTELLTGRGASAGEPGTLAPGDGEIWRP